MLECLFCIAISPYWNTFNENVHSEWGGQISLGHPLYASVSYDEANVREVGQYLPMDLYGAQIGFRKGWAFIEIGYYWPKESPLEVVENEIVEQVLENDHGKPGWRPKYFEYNIKPGIGGRVGADFKLNDTFSVFAAYRFLVLEESYKMCTAQEFCTYPVPEGGKYWVNSDARNLSGFQIGFTMKLGY